MSAFVPSRGGANTTQSSRVKSARAASAVAPLTEKPRIKPQFPVADGMYFSLSQSSDIELLKPSFNRLPPDEHRPGQFRRYNKVTYYPMAGRFDVDPDTTFYQSSDLNTFNKGKARRYEPVEWDTLKIMSQNLLTQFTNTVIQQSPERRQMYMDLGHIDPISIFQIRTICYPESKAQFQKVGFAEVSGEPTPEGVHRDGMDYVMINCVNRQNIEGGLTSLYYHQDDEEPFVTMELQDGFTILLDDHRLYHYVSKIQSKDKINDGIRDIFVLTLEPWKD